MLKIDFSDFYPLAMEAYEDKVLEIHDRMEFLKKDQDQFLGWIDYTKDYSEEIERARILGESCRKYEALSSSASEALFWGPRASTTSSRTGAETRAAD